MGQYAAYEHQADIVDLFTIDAEFDQFDGKVDWDDQSGLMYALNESATSWRSRQHSDWLEADA